ncbi:MAG: hypothetical protein ACRDJU_11995 [Actinomycetota bacterium]
MASTWAGAAWSWHSGLGALLEWTASLRLGASRLVGSFLRRDPVLPQERDHLTTRIAEQLSSLPDLEWPSWCVAAGGSVKAIARMLMASGDAGNGVGPLNGVRLDAADVATLAERLLAMDPGQEPGYRAWTGTAPASWPPPHW